MLSIASSKGFVLANDCCCCGASRCGVDAGSAEVMAAALAVGAGVVRGKNQLRRRAAFLGVVAFAFSEPEVFQYRSGELADFDSVVVSSSLEAGDITSNASAALPVVVCGEEYSVGNDVEISLD